MFFGKTKMGAVMITLAMISSACGDDGGTTPDAMVMDDAAGPPPAPTLQLGSYDATDSEDRFSPTGAADYSCNGSRTLPMGGEDSTFTITVKDFKDDNSVSDVCVRFYSDNQIPETDSCDPEDGGLLSDAEGGISVTAPEGGWYAYRVFPRDGAAASQTIVGSVQVNEAAPANGGNVDGTSVNQATLDLIPTIYGFRRAAGKAIIAGIIYDCGGDSVYGATIRVAMEDGTYVEEGERGPDPHYRYFNGDNFPSADQTFTHADGLYAVANVELPMGSDTAVVFVEVWGRTSEEQAEPQLIGCEQVRVFGDSISIVNIEPLRSDGPACPGLS